MRMFNGMFYNGWSQLPCWPIPFVLMHHSMVHVNGLSLDCWPPTHGQAGVHTGNAERVPNHALLSQVLLYSGKLSREKTFVDFEVWEPSAKVFSAKFGGMPHPPTIGFKQSVKVFSVKFSLPTGPWKFSPLKIYRYTVHTASSCNFVHTTIVLCYIL